MADANAVIPPPPPGFTLVEDIPPPPPGFTMVGESQARQPQGVPAARQKSMREQVIEAVVPLLRPGGVGKAIGANIDAASYAAGAEVNDLAAKVLPEKVAAGLGVAANVGVQALPMLLGGEAAKATSPSFRAGAENLMQSALKPTLKNLKNGNAAKAIQTMLDEGISVSTGGVKKMRDMIHSLNDDISAAIKASPATINKRKVAAELNGTLEKFSKQVSPNGDLSAIRSVWDEFINHPLLVGLGDEEAKLAQALAQKESSHISALQNAGRYQTMAAQQKNLAHGGGVNTSRIPTPLNEPYMNVGSEAAGGGRSLSPSAYPANAGLIGQPRIPGRYTENAQRVQEAQSAADDFLKLVELRKSEVAQAKAALDAHRASGKSDIPVQLAQEIKQGTYRILDGKYGEVGSASTEAQKALARGLKNEIAEAVPEVSQLNAKESALLNALKVAEKRVLMSGNSHLGGLAWLSHSPAAWAAFMADRSNAFKSIVARMMNAGQEQIPATAARLGIAGFETLSRDKERR